MLNFRQMLKDKGLQASQQRIKILQILEQDRIHPTADNIYKLLLPEMPSLSKTTVYNTLKILSEKGMIKTVSVFENELRYEYNRMPHAHFKCLVCDKIIDVEQRFNFMENKIIEGNKITEHHINLKGICSSCLSEDTKNA
ncbi:MAG: transcriptional repressor [Candidatus Cloacimonadota bacterium]|nr:MAG: transcriptional repressor [Candidatus Cloacimonadota bacterium]